MTMSRARTLRRCLRLIDAGATIEHALGEAYNAGHVDGSDVKRFTDAETDLLQGIALLSDSDVAAMVQRFPTLADLVQGVRIEAEAVFDAENELSPSARGLLRTGDAAESEYQP